MDRSICYSQEQIRSFDFLSAMKDYLKGGSRLAQALLGPTDTICTGLTAAAQSVPDMTFKLAAGQIMQWAPTDANPFGGLDADTEYIYQQGFTPEQTINLTTAQLSAGQSQWALVRCRFTQVDAVRVGDPTGGVLPYWNSSNPLVPLQGVNDNGGIQNTVRKGFAEISVIYGTPATTNSEIAPVPGSGYVGLYLVKLTFGQTTITNGQILACPAGIPGYAPAPFWMGVRAQHHKGTAYGQAPQIDVTQEITGVVPFPNLPTSNNAPPAVGGNITAPGVIPIISIGTVNPNGNLAGKIEDLYYDKIAGNLYICTQTGTSGTAIWTVVNSTAVTPMKYTRVAKSATFSMNGTSGTFYEITANSSFTAQLPPNPKDGTVYKAVVASGSGKVTITADGLDKIIQGGVGSSTMVLELLSGCPELVALDGGWYVS